MRLEIESEDPGCTGWSQLMRLEIEAVDPDSSKTWLRPDEASSDGSVQSR